MPSKADKWKDAGKDVVVIHQLPRGKLTPNPSPYPLKLETYCRMAEIEFVNDFEKPMSAKGKTPWITFNGEAVADSQFCIAHLRDKLGKDLNERLSAEDRAVARAMRALVEDHLYFLGAYQRWVLKDPTKLLPKIADFPGPAFARTFMLKMMAGKIRKQVNF